MKAIVAIDQIGAIGIDNMMPEDLFKRIIATPEDQVTEIYSDDDLVIVDIRL